MSGSVSGGTYGLAFGTGYVVTGAIGYRSNGTPNANTYDFRFSGDTSNLVVSCLNAKTLSPPTLLGRNSPGLGTSIRQGVFCQDFQQTVGAVYSYLLFGDLTKDVVTVRPGGSGSSVCAIPQSACGATDKIALVEWTEDTVAATAQTRGVYVLANGWGANIPSNALLYIEAEYLNSASGWTTALAAGTETVNTNDAWTLLTATYIPGRVGPVKYRVWLCKYVASAKIYMDAALYSAGGAMLPARWLDGDTKLTAEWRATTGLAKNRGY